MPVPLHPILVISYVDETRAALISVLSKDGAVPMPCSSFCEAEKHALKGLYSGMLVDLPSIIRSKGEEKIVAYTLANFIPTLRVRTMGGMLVPMAMPGSAKQDKSLDAFLNTTCSTFIARRLRQFRRHPVCLTTLITHNNEKLRGFTLNLSWGGMFIVDLHAERFSVGDQITVTLTEFGCHIPAKVRRIELWGTQRLAPGIGISFSCLPEELEAIVGGIIRTRKEFDPDRLSA